MNENVGMLLPKKSKKAYVCTFSSSVYNYTYAYRHSVPRTWKSRDPRTFDVLKTGHVDHLLFLSVFPIFLEHFMLI